jgi:hypothetical protein
MWILQCERCKHDGEMDYNHEGAGLTCGKCGSGNIKERFVLAHNEICVIPAVLDYNLKTNFKWSAVK